MRRWCPHPSARVWRAPYLLFFPVPDNDVALRLRRRRDEPLAIPRKGACYEVTLPGEQHRADAFTVRHEVNGNLRSEDMGAGLGARTSRLLRYTQWSSRDPETIRDASA